jgi:hypothetical protein
MKFSIVIMAVSTTLVLAGGGGKYDELCRKCTVYIWEHCSLVSWRCPRASRITPQYKMFANFKKATCNMDDHDRRSWNECMAKCEIESCDFVPEGEKTACYPACGNAKCAAVKQ